MNIEWDVKIGDHNGAKSVLKVTVIDTVTRERKVFKRGMEFMLMKNIEGTRLMVGDIVRVVDLLIPGFTNDFICVSSKNHGSVRVTHNCLEVIPVEKATSNTIEVEDHSRRLAEKGYAVNAV